MKITISSTGPNLDSPIDPRFGRCQYFLIVDGKGKLLKSIPNEGGRAMRGAGVVAAQIVANEGVEIVITGNIGPNAFMILNQARIKIFISPLEKSVKEVLEMYKEGKLTEVKTPLPPGFGPGRRRFRRERGR